jgi:hypothetical protein
MTRTAQPPNGAALAAGASVTNGALIVFHVV